MLVYSLVKSVYNKGLILYELTYKKGKNTYKFPEDEWQGYLQTEQFESQKNMLHIVMKQLNSFYEGINDYHNKKYQTYFAGFNDPIMKEFTKKVANAYQEHLHLKSLVLYLIKKKIIPTLQTTIMQKSTDYIISLIALTDFFLFENRFAYLDNNYGISCIKKHYSKLER